MRYTFSEIFNKEISELGFGGFQLGNNDMWNGTSYSDGVLLVKEAIEKGITFFDTAPEYGNGVSERIIGEAIKGYREKVIINTKFGHSAEGVTDFSIENIEKSINESLVRLNTDYIDSVILHNPDRLILEGSTEHCNEFVRLKEKGLVKACGVSVDTLEELMLVLENLEVDIFEVTFNIMYQEAISVFDKIEEKDIILIIKVPLDSGWLSGKYNKHSVFTGIRARWTKEDIKFRSKIVKKIKKIVKSDDLVPTALGFILSYNAVTTVIPGTVNSKQLNSNIFAVNQDIDSEIRQKLIELYQDYLQGEYISW
ncbi:MAG: aldo/keto reductase [Candidatus Izemoplasma sp.]